MITIHFFSVRFGRNKYWLKFDAVFRNVHYNFEYCGTELDVGEAPLEFETVDKIKNKLSEITGLAPYDDKIEEIKSWVKNDGTISIQ